MGVASSISPSAEKNYRATTYPPRWEETGLRQKDDGGGVNKQALKGVDIGRRNFRARDPTTPLRRLGSFHRLEDDGGGANKQAAQGCRHLSDSGPRSRDRSPLYPR